MSKKSVLTLIVAIFLISAATLFYFFNKNGGTGEKTSVLPNNQFGDFFPTSNAPTNSDAESISTEAQPAEEKKLFVISEVPISGSEVFEKTKIESGTTTKEIVVRYAERATGHIFDFSIDKKSGVRISNTTIPKVYEAKLLSTKNQAIYRYLDRYNNIDTYIADIKENPQEESLENNTALSGVFMRKNIAGIVVSPDERNIFTLVKNPDQNSSIQMLGNLSLTSNPNTEKLIFNSAISEWIPKWVNENVISLHNNSSFQSPGYLYFLNPKTKAFQKILGPINGLSPVVSPDTKKVFYSMTNPRGIETRYFNTVSGDAFILPNQTLAEKCVWANNSVLIYCAVPNYISFNNLPDSWYLGDVNFNDSIYVIDLEKQTSKLVMNGSDYSTPFDVINLQVSNDEKYLTFTNKRDLKLWGLEIK